MTTTAPAGLRGVVVAETTIGGVRGDEGFYHYGPYPATGKFSNISYVYI